MCIKRRKKLDWKATIDIAIEICAALKHAHDIGVIHRDLKPANIILTQNDHVKLGRLWYRQDLWRWRANAIRFGPWHGGLHGPNRPPARVSRSHRSLRAGSLMYAMLTGRPPFSGKSTTEVIESLKRDRPVPLDIITELPEELTDLVHQLLEKDPADRPPTASAVMNRLKSMRAGLHRARPSSRKNLRRKWRATPAPDPIPIHPESSQAAITRPM